MFYDPIDHVLAARSRGGRPRARVALPPSRFPLVEVSEEFALTNGRTLLGRNWVRPGYPFEVLVNAGFDGVSVYTSNLQLGGVWNNKAKTFDLTDRDMTYRVLYSDLDRRTDLVPVEVRMRVQPVEIVA